MNNQHPRPFKRRPDHEKTRHGLLTAHQRAGGAEKNGGAHRKVSSEIQFKLRVVDQSTRIQYSDRYSDDQYEYRHVVLPKPLLRLVPKDFFTEDGRTLRLLADAEWRGIGIMQSLGWEHYEVHGTWCFFRGCTYLKRSACSTRAPRPALPTTEGLRRQQQGSPQITAISTFVPMLLVSRILLLLTLISFADVVPIYATYIFIRRTSYALHLCYHLSMLY